MLLRSYIIRIIEMLSLLGAIAIVIAAYYPTYMVDEDGNTVRVAERNIHSIVQAQKKYFAVNGKFFSIFSSEYSQLTEIEGVAKCTWNCRSCEYAVAVDRGVFTVTAKCPYRGDSDVYIGYVYAAKDEFGTHGYYNKCSGQGVFIDGKYYTNRVGSCVERQGLIGMLHSSTL
ncbi:MAG: hypothetical protein D6B27_04715 [Gammaproteobacteria bacterium]|nr:MAG: hypothetical protein D6B27_04715 [Gammaproteobacteria bacterium]